MKQLKADEIIARSNLTQRLKKKNLPLPLETAITKVMEIDNGAKAEKFATALLIEKAQLGAAFFSSSEQAAVVNVYVQNHV